MSADEPAPPAPEKVAAESLNLRARPRPVARFRRGLIIGATGAAGLGLSFLAWTALAPRGHRAQHSEDPAAPAAPAPAEALSRLPKDYGEVAPPKLGPPLPGDLGRAIISPSSAAPEPAATRPAAEDAIAAEQSRMAAERRAAREAGVMVQISARGGPLVSEPASGGDPAPLMAEPKIPIATAAGQAGKLAVLEGQGAGAVRNAYDLAPPASPYQVMAGDVISAALVTGLDSDLPGTVIAQVTQNVYDTVTGRVLLIPQGARLIGAYDSGVALGQKRALVVWRRLVLPNGWSMPLDNLPATDTSGYAGLRDEVDSHAGRLLQGVGVSTLMSVGSELSLDDDRDLARALQRSTQQSASQAGQQVVGRQLDVQPTLRVRPGWPLKVIVHKDLVLRPWRPA